MFIILTNLTNSQSKKKQITKIQINNTHIYHLIYITQIYLLTKQKTITLTK